MTNAIEPTLKDVLDTLNDYAARNVQHFDEIRKEIGGIKTEIGGIKENVDMIVEEVGGSKVEISGLKSDIASIKSQMVTKSYLDDKLADLRGDLVTLTRKEDIKLKATVNILADKKVLSKDETKKIFSMEPFTQLAL